jgi:phosphatidylglycerophosphate synthase
LLDGMVAIEGGRASKSGEIYNELPDRVSDVAILLCAGFAAGEPWGAVLGWSCALLALMTAYVRALGVTAGASSAFQGPMAKPHRMATLTVACLLSALAVWFEHPPRFLFLGLCVVAAGSALTVARRTLRIVRELEAR